MTTGYQQLGADERVAISALQLQRLSLRGIASRLGRSASTISRELRRNALPDQPYRAEAAQAQCRRRRAQARPARKLDPHGPLWPVVSHMLLWRWSPAQIAHTLQRMHPHEPRLQVSHETLYNAIYAHPRGELRSQLIACLRQARSTRRPRSGGQDRRGQIPEMVSIHVRPPEVDDRLMPGHWEGDLIRGAGNASAVGVGAARGTNHRAAVAGPVAQHDEGAGHSNPPESCAFPAHRDGLGMAQAGSNLARASRSIRFRKFPTP